ncbi:MAG: CDP-glucose 4,6-dehydratase [Nanoarchaeota archaeon]
MENLEQLNFWKDKKVLITGHTGFKGTWLTIWLKKLGAEVIGFSLEEYPNDQLFNETNISSKMIDIRGNVQDLDKLKQVFTEQKPEIIFHLAAQPLVRKSYDEPLDTIKTNVLGTTNVLECIRGSDSIKVAVIITSDKCYENKEWVWGYRESDEMGGHDPYSCSKGCIEILVKSYRDSFFKKQSKYVASARAGNVIGGGDWSEDRLIPDCIRALRNKQTIEIRYPNSTRPWQHVLEPLSGYLKLAEKMWIEEKYDEGWNFGPRIDSIKPVGELVNALIGEWGEGSWADMSKNDEKKHEASSLSLDISKSYLLLNWKPKLDFTTTISFVVGWYKNYNDSNAYELCYKQIEEYERK